MRIKIIGDNNCARATRHLLRLAGFAVTEFLPVEAITQAPHFGFAITIELSPATHPSPTCMPDTPTHDLTDSVNGETSAVANVMADVSLPSSAEVEGTGSVGFSLRAVSTSSRIKTAQAEAYATGGGHIHFDSVDSALEAAVLRHVTQLAAAPVIVDRPGGVVHSERELRIIVPLARDAQGESHMDEAAAVAVEFGVLRGMLDLVPPPPP